MDAEYEEEATQPSTQPLPPTENDDQDYSGVICFLHPCSNSAIAIVRRAQKGRPDLGFRLPVPDVKSSPHKNPTEIPRGDDDRHTQHDEEPNGKPTAMDLALRHYPGPRDASAGFLFGRNYFKCDVVMHDNTPVRRISNVHFRIYVNSRGALMLEDLSTNGTWVDNQRLALDGEVGRKRVLSPGSVIHLCPGHVDRIIRFVVRIPKVSGHGFRTAIGPELSVAPSTSPSPNQIGIQPGHAAPVDDGASFAPAGQHKNVAAVQRNPFGQNPDDQHAAGRALAGKPLVIADKDRHTMNRTPVHTAWGGDRNYQLANQIGKGAFATVNKAYERNTGDAVAVKILAKRTFATQVGAEKTGVKKEIDILQQLQHDNIVKYVTCFEDIKYVYLVMEYIEFGDLSTYLNNHGTMPETITKQVVQQVLRGIEYIHAMGISHRDLKPDNILIACEEPIQVKISDFGLAKMVNNEETFLKTFCGTMLYLAPEVFPGYMSILMADAQGVQGNIKRKRLPIDDAGPQKSERRHRRPYNQAVDMWSLGCVVYALLCGSPPFEGKSQDEMCRLVTRGTFDEEKLLKNVGPHNHNCVDFLRQLLQVIPESRMMEVEALRHPWLSQSSEESPGGSIEDEFRGVGYSGRGQDQVGETGDEEEEEELERDEEEEEEEENLESGLPTLRAADVINNALRGSLAQMNVSQDNPNPYDLCTSDAGEDSDFESLINSQEGFTQGTTGLSVIDRERAHANNYDHSLRVSSDVFPEGMTSVSGSSHEESDSRVSTPDTRGGPYQSGGESSSHSGSLSGAESKLNQLNFSATTFHTPPLIPSSQPNPQSTPKRNNKDDSFSFAQHFFSPESLRINQSLVESRVDNHTDTMFPAVVSMDEDLPSTQPVNSQAPATDRFKTPPIPWGRLTPLPGSIYAEPIVLVQQLVSFGRASNCTIQPGDIRISKHHIALQIHHPNKNLQNDPRTSVVGEWKPEPGMVVSFNVLGRAGVYVGRDRYSNGSSGRLWDGDEIFLFKDIMAGGQEEFIGFKVELTVGDVKRVGTASYRDRTYIPAPKTRNRHPVISAAGTKSSVQNQHRQTSPVA